MLSLPNLIRLVLVGPTGKGKSQFGNFLHKDLTNSIYRVSCSLNSCTMEPQSTIIERQNVKIELIDSPGSSDSNNNDENNLKVLTKYLRMKNEIHQILLVLSFEDRLSRDTRDYLKILSWIFTPLEFISNLIVIFTFYPSEPDDEDKKKLEERKKEINEELNKIFEIPAKNKGNIPPIPVYCFNTKIKKRDNLPPFFDLESLRSSEALIEEIKFRMQSKFYCAIKTDNLECDKIKISQRVENERQDLIQMFKELESNIIKREKLKIAFEDEKNRYTNFLNQYCNNIFNRYTIDYNALENTVLTIGTMIISLGLIALVLI